MRGVVCPVSVRYGAEEVDASGVEGCGWGVGGVWEVGDWNERAIPFDVHVCEETVWGRWVFGYSIVSTILRFHRPLLTWCKEVQVFTPVATLSSGVPAKRWEHLRLRLRFTLAFLQERELLEVMSSRVRDGRARLHFPEPIERVGNVHGRGFALLQHLSGSGGDFNTYQCGFWTFGLAGTSRRPRCIATNTR
jgi:hypothetical protein